MQVVTTDRDALRLARAEIDAELDAVEAAASRFRADSELSVLARSRGHTTVVSPLLAELIRVALTAARRTDGDVDPTIGAAVVALGYDHAFVGANRPAVSVVSMETPAHWSMVALDGRSVRLPVGLMLDLGATAKAVAADRCAHRVFAALGCGVLVNLGGDIATAGPAPAGGWQIRVADGPSEPQCSITLPSGATLATSSTLRRSWRRGDQVVHHILDPRTGLSADPVWRTVTVAAPRCVDANTMSTAAVIRGHRAVEWLDGLGFPARLVDQEGNVRKVGGWPDGNPERHARG